MKSILDILLDPTDRAPLELMSDEGELLTFEQVAIVPHDKKLYCILKPLDYDGIADDEALVFRVEDGDEEPILQLERDEETCLEIFDVYYGLIEEELNKQKK